MKCKIALAGNPNSGKTTLFNALTGSNQFVGNWPGVTVEKKEGKLKRHKDVQIMDLPGIYSLSPYTLEEVVSRNYLIDEKPDAIINIVDGTNLERNLYLTTQLLELGIPVVVAVNMIDIVEKNKDEVHLDVLAKELGCEVYAISALKETGIKEVVNAVVKVAADKVVTTPQHKFDKNVEEALMKIEKVIPASITGVQRRFYAIKFFERDEKVVEKMPLTSEVEEVIKACEIKMDDDSESVITNERYVYITSIIKNCQKKSDEHALTISDKIDRIVTNRWLALPIFVVVMWLVYYVSVSTVGDYVTVWANDGVFGEGWDLFGLAIPSIPALVEGFLVSVNAADWLQGLILEGIVGGVGAVLGFVPQMLVLFIFLAFLEGCGYMARVAFIMDRIFRRFGLSGKSFIPMLIGTGCGIPGIMASRTIESDRDRKMTIITTTFIPCGAKLPIIAMIAGAMFGGAGWVSTSAYFLGIGAIIVSGIMLKKTKMFVGDPAPFVMELPAYHMPTVTSVLRSMWERGWSFIKKAGTVVLLASIVIWFLQSFGMVDGSFGMVEDLNDSILATLGNMLAWIFIPLGFGDWQATVATITGLVAKEVVVATLGVLYGFAEVSEDGVEFWATLSANYTAVATYSFLAFNLLCAPCFAAIGAIRREMNNGKWTAFAVAYQTIFAYVVALIIYQFANFAVTGVFSIWLVVAVVLFVGIGYMLFRPYPTIKK